MSLENLGIEFQIGYLPNTSQTWHLCVDVRVLGWEDRVLLQKEHNVGYSDRGSRESRVFQYTYPQLFILIPEGINEGVVRVCVKQWLKLKVILDLRFATQGRERNAC
jgi:hypothetical protein